MSQICRQGSALEMLIILKFQYDFGKIIKLHKVGEKYKEMTMTRELVNG